MVLFCLLPTDVICGGEYEKAKLFDNWPVIAILIVKPTPLPGGIVTIHDVWLTETTLIWAPFKRTTVWAEMEPKLIL